jgi:hypothetical protein
MTKWNYGTWTDPFGLFKKFSRRKTDSRKPTLRCGSALGVKTGSGIVDNTTAAPSRHGDGSVRYQQFYISSNMPLAWRKMGYRNEARRYGSVPDPETVWFRQFYILNKTGIPKQSAKVRIRSGSRDRLVPTILYIKNKTGIPKRSTKVRIRSGSRDRRSG